MDFSKRLGAVDPETSFFTQEGYCVWCGTVVQGKDGRYYLFYSRWPRELGHQAWVTHSQVAYAVSDSPYGNFKPRGLALAGSGRPGGWDRDVVHNPTVLCHDGKYYMYYMGNYGNGEYWDHRNHQRVGLAIADDPAGPWTRFDTPLIDVTPGSFDHLLTSNPTAAQGPDGLFYMVYKAVADGEMPKGGRVICAVAIAKRPEGPFMKQPHPIMINPENNWSVEDPYIWVENGRFYALVKDFQGYFTGRGPCTVALFTSADGIQWLPDEAPFAFDRSLRLTGGDTMQLDALERPQLLLQNGVPVVLYCAGAARKDRLDSFNVAIPIK